MNGFVLFNVAMFVANMMLYGVTQNPTNAIVGVLCALAAAISWKS